MAANRRPLLAGNWKMNGLRASLAELPKIADAAAGPLAGRVDLLVCPPATLIAAAVEQVGGSGVAIGGQDCHPDRSGAHTGDISAEMLRDAGAVAAIVGHSERRADHGETDALVRKKAAAAMRAGLAAIVCVGETREDRERGRTVDVVEKQLGGSVPDTPNAEALIIAYEPVWAIGSGLTPTPADVAEVHGAIRRVLAQRFGGMADALRILYGGSVKPDNATPLLTASDVDGALVGGASLKADDFLGIARVYLKR
jgi:triosephosphate isomerase